MNADIKGRRGSRWEDIVWALMTAYATLPLLIYKGWMYYL